VTGAASTPTPASVGGSRREPLFSALGESGLHSLREYHIPDISNWKNHDAFESAFADLLRDLRAQA